MEVMYCKKWWFYKKIPVDVIDEQTARQHHKSGEAYSVVMSENNVIQYIIDVSENNVSVSFMNENKEQYLIYAFRREKEDDIFLSAAYYYNYEDGEEIENMMFSFHLDGELIMSKWNRITGDLEEREANVDVTCNWDKFPKFGEYSSLLVLERGVNM